jgi:hypothetical protein
LTRHLKHTHDLSDEAACERWLENPYWQFFTGEVFFQTCLPCDSSSLTRWRQRLGEAGMEELLAQTINVAKAMKAVDARELSRVIVDSLAESYSSRTTNYLHDLAFHAPGRLVVHAKMALQLQHRHVGLAGRELKQDFPPRSWPTICTSSWQRRNRQ